MDARERFYKNRWGIFTHFLCRTEDAEAWNRSVEAFDTDKLAKQLHEAGAGYYFITIMQGTRYMLAPNATYDKICGTKPGEACAKRDLILDLYHSLSKYGIDLCLYFTGDGPWKDAVCGPKMGYTDQGKHVTEEFVRNWASVLSEYATRYGDKIKAWWVDGCYEWFGYRDELLDFYYDAIKGGNPDALATFNNGVQEQCYKWYCKEDYTAGEFNEPETVPDRMYYDGSRAHILAPLGDSCNGEVWGRWCQKGVSYTNAYLKKYVSDVNAAGGIVTLDIYIDECGSMDEEQLATVKGL